MAIKLNQSYIRAYHNRGIAYQCLKMYDEASADYETARDLYKNSGDNENAERCEKAATDLKEKTK
jgi:Tfp pilus assembly protein PilF